jgi:hypothetical protein
VQTDGVGRGDNLQQGSCRAHKKPKNKEAVGGTGPNKAVPGFYRKMLAAKKKQLDDEKRCCICEQAGHFALLRQLKTARSRKTRGSEYERTML